MGRDGGLSMVSRSSAQVEICESGSLCHSRSLSICSTSATDSSASLSRSSSRERKACLSTYPAPDADPKSDAGSMLSEAAAVEIPKAHETLIIFDYDDTLLCTSTLCRLGDMDKEKSRALAKHLRQIQRCAVKLLELSLTLGRTFIVTNAVPGWVESTANQYLPQLVPLLEQVQVISARGNYEDQFPGQRSIWKIHAFREIRNQLDLPDTVNLVSVGDSEIDMDAVRALGQDFSQAFVKTIKLKEKPSAEELWKQLDLVSQKLEGIALEERSLKVNLHRRR